MPYGAFFVPSTGLNKAVFQTKNAGPEEGYFIRREVINRWTAMKNIPMMRIE